MAAKTVAPKTVAAAAGIAPRTRNVVVRDEYGLPYQGDRFDHVMATLSRPDLAPGLDAHIHTVAYALAKSVQSARMSPVPVLRVRAYSAYQLCALVARIANECQETTVGGICDRWIASHQNDL